MNATLTIYFNPVENYGLAVKFVYNLVSSLTIVYQYETYVNAPAEFAAFLNANHSDKLTAVVEDQTVTITAINPSATFSGGAAVPPRVASALSFTYFNPIPVTPPDGLDSDRYLVNNEIWIPLSSDIPVDYFEISLKNLTTQETSGDLGPIRAFNNKARANISAIAKSLLEYPHASFDYITPDRQINTAARFEITVKLKPTDLPKTTQYTMTKTLIRGGNRTNNTNQTIPALSVLRPAVNLPVWEGYDTAEYYLNETNQVRKRLLASVSPSVIDYRRSRGCNSLYFMFLNQQGGYSYWLFDSHAETESNQAMGSFIRNNEVEDLGSDSTSKLQVYSKVPAEYIGLINDLIVSSEIYVFLDGMPVRITSKNNSVSTDNIKRSYPVTLNFGFEYRYNPSPKWSN